MKTLTHEQLNYVSGSGFWDSIRDFFSDPDRYDDDVGVKVYEKDNVSIGIGGITKAEDNNKSTGASTNTGSKINAGNKGIGASINVKFTW